MNLKRSRSFDSLPCTGERVIERDYRANRQRFLIYLFHLATYRFVLPWVLGKNVLDFGCGTGYGTADLADHCKDIIGIDISDNSIRFADDQYQKKNLHFKVVDRVESKRLPFCEESFDVVVSFQVAEHISDLSTYFSEISRVLRPEGLLILATPDRSTRLFNKQKPWNMFHVDEYDEDSLRAIISPYFSLTDTYKMTARDDILSLEMNRTAILRCFTYPFTFPGVPDRFRVMGLHFLKLLAKKMPTKLKMTNPEYGFGVEDIYIRKNAAQSLNLIILASKCSK
jgi:SAM-dependent methyltransferase